MAESDSPKAVSSTTGATAEKAAAPLVPWTLAWIQAVEKQREARCSANATLVGAKHG